MRLVAVSYTHLDVYKRQEITNNSAESVQTLKWYAGKVRDIKPGG